MPNLQNVTVTNGIPTAGTGVVSTLDGTFQTANGPIAVKAPSIPAVAADPALVVTLSPNNINPNGQTTMANSAPVVIASNQSSIAVSPSAQTSGGITPFSAIMASGTNATNVKASAGQIYKIEAFNNSGTLAYLKIYDSASAPTAGSGTPKKRVMVPPTSGAALSYDVGLVMLNGIGFTFTGGIADNDTTSVAASTFIVNIDYK